MAIEWIRCKGYCFKCRKTYKDKEGGEQTEKEGDREK